ncbi:MAG TPA: VOC family protein [Anaerolineae bacterium]|nr:VOC family protein [Anaerolineae bacterium]HXW00208.1 VOC family protein [Anaerolineae bacterium]
MKNLLAFKSANTILYCQRWQETVAFYQNDLQLPVTFASDWFVEFQLGGPAHLSVADERRASIKSSHGAGITLTFQVESADETWAYLQRQGLQVEPLKNHAWGARVFYFYDPEGHRLEIWSST